MRVCNSHRVITLAIFLTACASTSSQVGKTRMEEQVYTLGVWHVKEGREAEFVSAWKELGAIFASLPHPPLGKGVLVQSVTQPQLFYSFGPWRAIEDIAAMRADSSAQAGIQKVRELCTEAIPGTFRVVAQSQ